MDRARKLFRERGCDQPVSLDSAKSPKGFGNNLDRKMAFAPGAGAGMTCMKMTVIGDLKNLRTHCRLQLGSDRLLNMTHIRRLSRNYVAADDVSTRLLARSILECENFRLILAL